MLEIEKILVEDFFIPLSKKKRMEVFNRGESIE